jgi:phospholipid/cholesterol/gamma-HCH transport system permease protein
MKRNQAAQQNLGPQRPPTSPGPLRRLARTPGNLLAKLGAMVQTVAADLGGVVVLLFRTLGCLIPPRIDTQQFWRCLYKMGNESVPIVVLTAFFSGGIMVVQAGVFVKRFGATSMVGWGAGYAVLREIGPILIGLMFSGRVGSNNTAELGTMTVTEQVDGLRALAINPISYLVAPRVLAMMIMLFLLTIIGDLVAISGAALFGKLLLQVEFGVFYQSMIISLGLPDLFHGLYKAALFGAIIALTSCHYGMTAKGGAVGVGRAVNAAVVASALGIVVADYFVTFLFS